ncbi:unnamed protein product [Urochloa decumbens]|uniref:Uncharacterized protein n=1 Tax=Urochloa decumbens TaxID=240449 RepID=A0ABC9BSE9_9POAL
MKGEGNTIQTMDPPPVLEKRSAKSEEVFGGGAMGGGSGITERPKTEGEAAAEAAAEAGSKGEPCAAGITERPRAEKEADYDSEKEYVRQNLEYKKMLTRPHNAPGKDGKRRTVVRLDKESIEIRMSRPPPTPYPRMSDGHIDRLERLMPGCRIRAEEDECTALGQKLIDRDAEMRRQYALYGYAELEFTDDDEDDDVDGMLKNWRSTAELKAAGCFDGY